MIKAAVKVIPWRERHVITTKFDRWHKIIMVFWPRNARSSKTSRLLLLKQQSQTSKRGQFTNPTGSKRK